MTPGAVYDVRWVDLDDWSLRRALMRFEGEHPAGTLMFRYMDGFAFLPLNPVNVMGATLAAMS